MRRNKSTPIDGSRVLALVIACLVLACSDRSVAVEGSDATGDDTTSGVSTTSPTTVTTSESSATDQTTATASSQGSSETGGTRSDLGPYEPPEDLPDTTDWEVVELEGFYSHLVGVDTWPDVFILCGTELYHCVYWATWPTLGPPGEPETCKATMKIRGRSSPPLPPIDPDLCNGNGFDYALIIDEILDLGCDDDCTSLQGGCSIEEGESYCKLP